MDLPQDLGALTPPPGYIVASAVRYPKVMTDHKSGRRYDHAVQLLNQALGDIPRGVGLSWSEAFDHAVTNVGGDDGLSAAVRSVLSPVRH